MVDPANNLLNTAVHWLERGAVAASHRFYKHSRSEGHVVIQCRDHDYGWVGSRALNSVMAQYQYMHGRPLQKQKDRIKIGEYVYVVFFRFV